MKYFHWVFKVKIKLLTKIDQILKIGQVSCSLKKDKFIIL